MKGFVLALQFLTVFPVKRGLAFAPGDLGRAMAWFPLAGAAQGLILVGAWFAFSALLPEGVVAALLLLVLALTNGGLHLDGFADTVDGLAGGGNSEERLRIMRDSSTGAVGAAFVVLLLLVKFMALRELPAEAKPEAIFLLPVLGRWAMVPLAYWAPYARPEGGLGAAFAGNSALVLAKATMAAAIMLAVLLGPQAVAFLAVFGVMIYMSSRYFKWKLGGVTGDVFGFHSEVAEALFLMMVLAMIKILSVN